MTKLNFIFKAYKDCLNQGSEQSFEDWREQNATSILYPMFAYMQHFDTDYDGN